ncbi:unnamed protein product [Brachionus calyciflorus]|uniref:Reverse transcriptase domain-containing protein n=1 Tax=Brachionus calyciflorus TaxID=104777 RepID=A0A814QQ47_9BILA|nr:unnamed protein product [Brachionus calyciflorus]
MKSSTIVMILKSDKPINELSSYRPISLINCLSKWLEKIINEKLKNWLEKENILPETQAGFRKNRRTQDQILRLNQAVLTNLKKKRLTGAVFFDLEKAFDKTPHNGILESVFSLNISPLLKNWIKAFIQGRDFKVRVDGVLSESKEINCGVPQEDKTIKDLIEYTASIDDEHTQNRLYSPFDCFLKLYREGAKNQNT